MVDVDRAGHVHSGIRTLYLIVGDLTYDFIVFHINSTFAMAAADMY